MSIIILALFALLLLGGLVVTVALLVSPKTRWPEPCCWGSACWSLSAAVCS